ncbi:hypothetical protein [Syntrophaceticus schinkii]|nr:hypothetical protein [Syntrophaceticus schinkii]
MTKQYDNQVLVSGRYFTEQELQDSIRGCYSTNDMETVFSIW